MRIIIRNLISVFFIFLIIAISFNSSGYSQENLSPYRPGYTQSSYKNKKDCLKNFNIGLALSNEVFFEKTKFEKNMLLNFMKCRMAAKYDASECYNLDGEDARACIEKFKELKSFEGFYSRLFLSTEITPELLRECPKAVGNMETCEKFIKATRRRDDSICKRDDYDCIAIVKLDASLAREQSTRDMIYFIKAIKDLKTKNCLKIKDMGEKRECQAYMNRDISICEEDREFKRVRNAYCGYMFK